MQILGTGFNSVLVSVRGIGKKCNWVCFPVLLPGCSTAYFLFVSHYTLSELIQRSDSFLPEKCWRLGTKCCGVR